MDALSLTFILFVLFLFSFFLASSESALAAAKTIAWPSVNMLRPTIFERPSDSFSAFVASLLNTSFIAICIMMLEQVILVYFVIYMFFISIYCVILCINSKNTGIKIP